MNHYGPPAGGGRYPPDVGFQQQQQQQQAPPPLAFQSAMLANGGPRPLAFGAPPMRPMMGFVPPRGPPMAMAAPFHVGGGGPPPMHIVPPHMQMQMAQQQQVAFHAAATPLPAGWSEHYTPQGMQYFYNAATGASTYERPTGAAATVAAPLQAATAPEPVASAAAAADSSGRWIEYKDAASGKLYYYHTATKETVWDQPEAFRMQQARDEVERMRATAAVAEQATGVSTSTSTALEDALASEDESAAEVAVAAPTKKKNPQQQESDDPKMYEHLTREQRVGLFKEFLEQRAVPPQMKWPDVQRFVAKEGFDKDPRWKFTALSAGDKKQSFAEYCTQAVNRQNIEKRRQVKKNREDFLALLADFQAIFAPGGAFAKDRGGRANEAIDLDDVVASAHFYAVRQDPRWLVIEDQKEKRSLFNGFMQDIARKHAQAIAKQRDVIKKRFVALVRKKVAARELAVRDKRRLDSELKKQLWALLGELAPSLGGKNAAGLKTIEKHDVYDWSEELLKVLRDEEHERRKRERELWREREAQLLNELDASLRAMAVASEITGASSWEHVRDRFVSATPADDGVETRQLSERAQVRVFERVVKELRAALRPAVEAVKSFLVQGAGGFEVTDACTFEGFVDALTDGIRASIEAKKPEDGEEADEEEPADESAGVAGGESEKRSRRAEKQAKQSELEALVTSSLEQQEAEGSSSNSRSPEYPAYVREVFGLLVQFAKEKKAKAGNTGDSSRDQRAARSTSRSRKRRRDSSPSPHSGRSVSRSRSRSRTRPSTRSRSASPHRSRKRHPHTQSKQQQSKPKPVLDRSVVWNTGSSGASPFAFDPLNGDEDMRLPLATRRTPTALTAEEESARAEEIIRQARLKLQREAKPSEEELEEGEELEDGEEAEEETGGEEAERSENGSAAVAVVAE